MHIDIIGKHEAKVLLNILGPRALGICSGVFHFEPKDMELKEAEELLKQETK